MTEKTKHCIVCKKNDHEIPLLSLNYQDNQYWICPQDFPILIHKPEKLIGILPGAENLIPAAHDD